MRKTAKQNRKPRVRINANNFSSLTEDMRPNRKEDFCWMVCDTWNIHGLKECIKTALEQSGWQYDTPSYSDDGGYTGNLQDWGPWAGLPNFRNFPASDTRKVMLEWARMKKAPESDKYLDPITSQSDFTKRLEKNVNRFMDKVSDDPLEYMSRFSSFIRDLSKDRSLKWIIGQSNVMGSPYTVVNPYDLFDRFHTADRVRKIAKRLAGIKYRANQILRPYGIRVSNEDLFIALTYGPKGRGKAARYAAKRTLSNWIGSFRNNHKISTISKRAQGWSWGTAGWDGIQFNTISPEIFNKCRGLARFNKLPLPAQCWAFDKVFIDGEFSDLAEAVEVITGNKRLVKNVSGGISGYHEVNKCLYSRHGISVYKQHQIGAIDRKGNYGNLCRYTNYQAHLIVIGPSGQTYHTTKGDSDNSYEKAARAAVAAWNKRKRAEKLAKISNPDIVNFLTGVDSNSCPLFYMDDSRAAGNCQYGTESWQARNGLSGDFVAGAALVPFLGTERVKNIVKRRMVENG